MKHLALVFAGIVLPAGTCLGQPTIPKDRIPLDAPAVVRAEIEKLYSASGDERGWACTRLEQMGEKAAPAIPFLAALLGDTALHREWIDPQGPYMDHPVGSLAAAALARIGKPAAETLLAALRSPDEKVRHGAVVGLFCMRQPPVDAVAAAMTDDSPGVRSSVALALGEIAREGTRTRRWSGRSWRRCGMGTPRLGPLSRRCSGFSRGRRTTEPKVAGSNPAGRTMVRC